MVILDTCLLLYGIVSSTRGLTDVFSTFQFFLYSKILNSPLHITLTHRESEYLSLSCKALNYRNFTFLLNFIMYSVGARSLFMEMIPYDIVISPVVCSVIRVLLPSV